jgi:hypothetical protein
VLDEVKMERLNTLGAWHPKLLFVHSFMCNEKTKVDAMERRSDVSGFQCFPGHPGHGVCNSHAAEGRAA